jgi:predicted HTH domain antitoxin
MSVIQLELEDDLAALLQGANRPIEQTAREMIVLELYRQGRVSSGKAAQLLGMPRWEFVPFASRLGLPFFDMTADEWELEKSQASES